ncbi:MAG TPA: hypothetical protein VJ602_04800, partial [Paludibacter sp.]|nr:hypothetical protein [Paludibacter sp.]
MLYANDAICQADSAVKGTRISLANLSDKMLQVVENKYSSVEKVLDKFSRKSLLRFQKKEANLRKNLQNKDSLASSSIFDNAQHQYGLL